MPRETGHVTSRYGTTSLSAFYQTRRTGGGVCSVWGADYAGCSSDFTVGSLW